MKIPCKFHSAIFYCVHCDIYGDCTLPYYFSMCVDWIVIFGRVELYILLDSRNLAVNANAYDYRISVATQPI